MLYEFHSRATGRVVMTTTVAEQILAILGRRPAPEGVITVDDQPAALACLEAAVAEQRAARQAAAQADTTPRDPFEDESRTPAPGLAQRAWPLMDMLRRAHAARKDITWEIT